MLLISALIATWLVGLHAPRVLVWIIATTVGVNLTLRSRRAARHIIFNAHRELNFYCKPSPHERRLVRASLRLAIDQTELRGLFPTTMARSEAIADWWELRNTRRQVTYRTSNKPADLGGAG